MSRTAFVLMLLFVIVTTSAAYAENEVERAQTPAEAFLQTGERYNSTFGFTIIVPEGYTASLTEDVEKISDGSTNDGLEVQVIRTDDLSVAFEQCAKILSEQGLESFPWFISGAGYMVDLAAESVEGGVQDRLYLRPEQECVIVSRLRASTIESATALHYALDTLQVDPPVSMGSLVRRLPEAQFDTSSEGAASSQKGTLHASPAGYSIYLQEGYAITNSDNVDRLSAEESKEESPYAELVSVTAGDLDGVKKSIEERFKDDGATYDGWRELVPSVQTIEFFSQDQVIRGEIRSSGNKYVISLIFYQTAMEEQDVVQLIELERMVSTIQMT